MYHINNVPQYPGVSGQTSKLYYSLIPAWEFQIIALWDMFDYYNHFSSFYISLVKPALSSPMKYIVYAYLYSHSKHVMFRR